MDESLGREDLSQGDGGMSLLQALWRRKALLLLGATAGLVLGALQYSRQAPVYQSSAEVLVVEKRPETPLPNAQAGMDYMGDYVSAHSRLIESPLIMGRAIESGAIPKGYSAGGISGSLSIRQDGNVLLLALKGSDPEDCRIILDAVIASYQEFLDETYRNVNEDNLKQITEKAGELQEEIKRLGKQYQSFLENKPLLWKGSNGNSLYEERLSAIEAKRSALAIERAEVEAQAFALRRAIEEGESQTTLLSMLALSRIQDAQSSSSSRKNPEAGAVATLQRELFPLRLREQTLLQDVGPQHPDVRAVRRQIEMTEEFYRTLDGMQEQIRLAAHDDQAEPMDPVQSYLADLETKVRSLEANEQALAELAQNEQDRGKELSDYEFQDRQLSGDLARAERFYETLITQLQGVNITKDLGGYQTSVLTPPARGYRIGPEPVGSMTPTAIFGLLLGCGLAYLAEITDKRFRTPEQIRQRLGLPVVGHVPYFRAEDLSVPEGSVLDASLCVQHKPKSVYAEAYRGVRTALYFSARGEGHKVIQVTSPSAGDGKSTVAANLAISIAKAGNRALMIDADLRKPRQHKLFGVSHGCGLSSVIAGKAEVNDAIQESGVEGLHLLASGPIPSDPAELLTSPRFAELLELLRDQYDFVIVDSPPLLVVTDPSVVAPRVDGVLLTIRITKGGPQQAVRAKEILETVEAKVLGVVVNDQDTKSVGYGYGYGRYRYGYGRYRYGYGGSYGYRSNDHYYQQDEEEAADGEDGRANGVHDGNGSTKNRSATPVPLDE